MCRAVTHHHCVSRVLCHWTRDLTSLSKQMRHMLCSYNVPIPFPFYMFPISFIFELQKSSFLCSNCTKRLKLLFYRFRFLVLSLSLLYPHKLSNFWKVLVINQIGSENHQHEWMKLNVSFRWAMEGENLLKYFLFSIFYQSQTKLQGRIEAFPYWGSQIPLALMCQACIVLQHSRNLSPRMTTKLQ